MPIIANYRKGDGYTPAPLPEVRAKESSMPRKPKNQPAADEVDETFEDDDPVLDTEAEEVGDIDEVDLEDFEGELGDDDLDLGEDDLVDDIVDDLVDDDLVDDLAEDDDVLDVGSTIVPSAAGDDDSDDDDDEMDPDDVEASLDDILKDRLVIEDAEVDDDDTPDVDDRSEGASVVIPKRPDEFVCQSCFLVKHPSQLADSARTLCRDCV